MQGGSASAVTTANRAAVGSDSDARDARELGHKDTAVATSSRSR